METEQAKQEELNNELDESLTKAKQQLEASGIDYNFQNPYADEHVELSEDAKKEEAIAILISNGDSSYDGLMEAIIAIETVKKNGISTALNDIANQCVVYQTISTDGENIYTIFG